MLPRDEEDEPRTDLRFLPKGPLADSRQAGLQHVLSECKLNTGGLGRRQAVAAELGPALTAGHFPPPWPWLGPRGRGRLHRCPRRGPPEPARGRQRGGRRKAAPGVPGCSLCLMLSGSVRMNSQSPHQPVRVSRAFLVFGVLVIFTQ